MGRFGSGSHLLPLCYKPLTTHLTWGAEHAAASGGRDRALCYLG
jgi:hypothetical protein